MGQDALGPSDYMIIQCVISRKKREIKLAFYMINIKVSSLLKCYWFWWVQPGMPKVPKLTSSQYLNNI